jgi:glycerol-3-phosphate dehydrogenase
VAVDLIIIGGGIVGAGVARDAALRGLRVVLLEKEDLASGTTSRSTRLIHGGLRYLRTLDVGLVREALTERRILLATAPHLTKPLPFLMPVYKGRGHGLGLLWTGMLLYDGLSLGKDMPHHHQLPPSECLAREASLKRKGLKGGFLFYDAQCDYPERLCLEAALDARANGADVRTHARVVGLLRDESRITGVEVEDEFTGLRQSIEAAVVVNAAGPWVDEVLRLEPSLPAPELVRSKGIHIVTKGFTHHALIMESEDGRVFFAIPWAGLTLLGTTDTQYTGRNEEVAADEADIRYLIKEIRRVLEVDLKEEDILYTTAGLRALSGAHSQSVGDITRRHQIIDHGASGGPSGLWTILGGKITTFRQIAEDVVDRILDSSGLKAGPCLTRERPLPGGVAQEEAMVHALLGEGLELGLSEVTCQMLFEHYGGRAARVFDRVRAQPQLATRLDPAFAEILAQVDVAVEEEFAQTAQDVLLRRLRIGLAPGVGRGALERVLQRMAELLGWDASRVEQERAAYMKRIERMTPQPLPN